MAATKREKPEREEMVRTVRWIEDIMPPALMRSILPEQLSRILPPDFEQKLGSGHTNKKLKPG